uniref:Uncharacterized protein n=1 Tax=Rhizophora mucronata TaxID=61149 RepID=A0A2P2N4Y0_RHIMU
MTTNNSFRNCTCKIDVTNQQSLALVELKIFSERTNLYLNLSIIHVVQLPIF